MPRECVFVHVGQAGVQLASPLWDLFCMEQGILPSGIMSICPMKNDLDSAHTFFMEHEAGTFVPRAILIDMEPNCIDTIRDGYYRHLFHSDRFIVGKEDAANNFARGYYTIGREFNGITMDRIRQMAEKCDGLQGFAVFRSTGGGSGSGFGSFLFDKLCTYFGRKSLVSFDVIPSPQSEVVEPYNAVFANHAGDGKVDVSFIFDNQSLSDTCARRLGLRNPNFDNYNRLLAQVISAMTSSLRFEGGSLNEFQTNLIPFPRIRFPLVSYAPVVGYDVANYDEFSVSSLVAGVFDTKNQMVRCNTRLGKYMAMLLAFRGPISPHEVGRVKTIIAGSPTSPSKVRFVDWAPPGFKVSVTERLPCGIPETEFGAAPRAVVAMMNTTAIVQPWSVIGAKFDLLWRKKLSYTGTLLKVSFYHGRALVGNDDFKLIGMEEVEFEDAQLNMKSLQEDYKDAEHETVCFREKLDLTIRGNRSKNSKSGKSARSNGNTGPIEKRDSPSVDKHSGEKGLENGCTQGK